MINEHCLKWDLNPIKLPRHIGIVMDGNGRWASKRYLPRIAGHAKGVERVQEITELCANLKVEALTLYAFSDENWRRPEDEVSGIMGLLRLYIRKERTRIIENNVRFQSIGDKQKLSPDIVELINQLEKDTEKNSGMFLSIALSYGAHAEILRAVKKVVLKIEDQQIHLNDLNVSLFEECLDTHNLPPLDMFVRTSGEYRISNFLLWQLAYAELFFDSTLWPDFNSKQFIKLLREFALRDRRFGMTPEQANGSTL
jgi:undecaprenyl diphosphate synthase